MDESATLEEVKEKRCQDTVAYGASNKCTRNSESEVRAEGVRGVKGLTQASQSVVPSLAALRSSWNLLEMQEVPSWLSGNKPNQDP